MNIKAVLTMGALVLACGAQTVRADETAAAEPPPPPPAEATAETAPDVPPEAKPLPKRPKMTPEQRAELKARREKMLAARRAESEAKMLEVVKKYIPEEDKAKALVKELEAALTARPHGPKGHRLPPPKRDGEKK